MPLVVTWHAKAPGKFSQIRVSVFDVQLVLTLAGNVVVDASWQLADENEAAPATCPLAQQVNAYLMAPDRQYLTIDLLTQGGDFYRRVWQAMLAIPLGDTISYSELAKQLGSGARAVARACSGNPYAGLIPCHRVVAKSGIGGFMGYTSGEMVELKMRILAAERAIALSRS